MKRSKFSLSNYKLLTCDLGELVPIGWFEALPGDTVQHATSALIRVSPLMAPVMHPVRVRVHHWFVPYRLLWDDWEDFITGGPAGAGAQSTFPYWNGDVAEGTLLDYLGLPPGSGHPDVSALPLRAYALIFNEFYRDQDLVAELPISTDGGRDLTTSFELQKVAWEKDYFTSARPWTQKGPDVSLPLGVRAPVISAGNGRPTFAVGGTGAHELQVANTGTYKDVVSITPSTVPGGPVTWNSPSLEADLTNATAVNVNDVRMAFALQRYEEARARYGSRYTEYLRYLGVRSSDARLQRPEYLGGGRQTIQFSEVLQTGPDAEGAGVADLKGHGLGAMRSNRYRRFFEEHGIVLSLLSVLPRTMYAQGIPRQWRRFTKEAFWQKELEHVGQQEIRKSELWATSTDPDGVWGYQDRYDEYRRQESGVSAEFRNLMDYWHYARLFTAEPVLNSSFVTSNPTKRVYAEQTQDALWMMCNHSIQARRMLSGSGRSFIF